MPQAFVTLFCEAIKAVLRTLSGLRFCSPGKRSATGEACRHAGRTTETQKAHPTGWALHLFDAWQFPTLTWGDPTLPSALRRFTSEFGMGSGGTTALVPPGKFFVLSTQFFIAHTALAALASVSHILQYAPSFPSLVALLLRKLLRTQL